MKNRSIILLVIISVGLLSGIEAKSNEARPINLLIVLDKEYGANYHYIIDIFEAYECEDYYWNITLTGLFEEITPCSYQSSTEILNTDILIPNIQNITKFDCLSVFPGKSHENLLESNETIDLIKEAMEKELIVTGWCKGVFVLAKADVINGKNVTGHDTCETACEAAGATFFSQVSPIQDGNIITSVRSRYYRTQICDLIAEACYKNLGIETQSSSSEATTSQQTTENKITTKNSPIVIFPIIVGLIVMARNQKRKKK